MTKALLIDVTARQIRAVTISDKNALSDMQKHVGGLIQVAASWDNGDTLYVDEESLFKPQEAFFRIAGYSQPMAGNGLLVGSNNEGENADHVIRLDALKSLVTFLNRVQVDAWAKGNASEPMMSISTIDETGKKEQTIVARVGAVFGSIPRRE